MTQTVNKPAVTVNKLPAILSSGVEAQKILVVGQKLATGNAVAGALVENISSANVKTKFGQGSMLQGQLDPIFKIFEDSGSNTLPRIDVIPLDDAGAGVQAISDIVIAAISGTEATVSGTAVFTIAGREYELSITLGETISGIGARLETLLTDADAPFTAVDAANTVTMTARNKGTVGNSFPVVLTGVEYTGAVWAIGNVSFSVEAFTTGATDPTLTSVLDVVDEIRYQTCLAPFEYGTDFLVKDFLDNRWNTTNKILDGVAIYASVDTKANLIVTGDALNSQSCVIIGDETQAEDNYIGDITKLPPYQVASQIVAYRSLRLTEGSNISNFTPASTYGALDGEGGLHLGSLPYFNTPIKDIDVFPTGKGFNSTEISELNDAGISVIGNNTGGTSMLFGEMLTTYKTDAASNVDTTFKFLNTVDTMSLSAEYIYRNLKSRFVQSRVTAGVPVAGYSTANTAIIKAYMLQLFKELGAIQLTVAGPEAETYFFNNISLIADYVAGKVTSNGDLPIVVQLRELLVNLTTKFGL